MIQGSNHARTARRAMGQDTCGRLPFPALIFSPRSRCLCRNVWLWKDFGLKGPGCFACWDASARADMIPAKGESTTDQLPMSSDGLVTSHLILRPAQRMFDVFVALLDPDAQTIQSDHLFQIGWRKRQLGSRAFCWGRQVGDQVPGGKIG